MTDSQKSPRLELDEEAFEGHARLFSYQFSQFFQRVMREYQHTFDGDLEKALIIHAMASTNISRVIGDDALRREWSSLDGVIPTEHQTPSNALSIAEATGIPRETTRRKIKLLIAEGLLMEDERGGYRLAPGFVQSEPMRALVAFQMREMIRLVNLALEGGFVSVNGSDG